MISLIICSRNAGISAELEENIKETIGVEFEVVLINNQENKYSIFEAYNLGVEKSKYPILCFMHDDILYYTSNWGSILIEHFSDVQTGAIGIAGGPYVAEMPGSWWGCVLGSMYVLPPDLAINEPQVSSSFKNKSDKYEVLLLDGVWLCIRKTLFDSIRFDDISYKGFHFYDVDISVQVSRAGYKLFAITNNLIRHFGKGNINLSWCDNAVIFNKKWQAIVPLACIDLTYHERCKAEYQTLIEYLRALSANGKSQKEVAKFAVIRIVRFWRGYFYYKTPAYFLKYIYLFLRN